MILYGLYFQENVQNHWSRWWIQTWQGSTSSKKSSPKYKRISSNVSLFRPSLTNPSLLRRHSQLCEEPVLCNQRYSQQNRPVWHTYKFLYLSLKCSTRRRKKQKQKSHPVQVGENMPRKVHNDMILLWVWVVGILFQAESRIESGKRKSKVYAQSRWLQKLRVWSRLAWERESPSL